MDLYTRQGFFGTTSRALHVNTSYLYAYLALHYIYILGIYLTVLHGASYNE